MRGFKKTVLSLIVCLLLLVSFASAETFTFNTGVEKVVVKGEMESKRVTLNTLEGGSISTFFTDSVDDSYVAIGKLSDYIMIGSSGTPYMKSSTGSLQLSDKVGIGTATPSVALEVVGSTNTSRLIIDSPWRGIQMHDSGDEGHRYDVIVGAISDIPGSFGIFDDTAGAYRFNINSIGNVGIGTTTPAEKLEVAGNIQVTAGNDVCIEDGKCLSDAASDTAGDDRSWLWAVEARNAHRFDSESNYAKYTTVTLANIDTAVYFDGKAWFAGDGGYLYNFNINGAKFVVDVGSEIKAMKVYKGNLWMANSAGYLFKVTSGGIITPYGDQGGVALDMEVFNDKLWVTLNYNLLSCTEEGVCTDHGRPIGNTNLRSLKVYDGKLWVGSQNGRLLSCDAAGVCTEKANQDDFKGAPYQLEAYQGELWLGCTNGFLYSCDATGSCESYGDTGAAIGTMSEFEGDLWVFSATNVFVVDGNEWVTETDYPAVTVPRPDDFPVPYDSTDIKIIREMILLRIQYNVPASQHAEMIVAFEAGNDFEMSAYTDTTLHSSVDIRKRGDIGAAALASVVVPAQN